MSQWLLWLLISTLGTMDEQAQTLSTMQQDKNRFLLLLAFGAVVIVMHLVTGSDPIVFIIAMLTVLIGIAPVTLFGFLNCGVILLLLIVIRYVGFPLIGKLLFFQPLDSNLIQPVFSFALVLIGAIAYLIAFLIIAKLDFKKPILNPISNPSQLNRISIISFIIGSAANLVIALQAGTDYSGITVANFYVPFLHLALIAAIAAVLCKSDGLRSWNHWILIIILVEIGFAFVRNSRMTLVDVVLCYVLTMMCYHGKVKWSRAVITGVIISILVTVITPIMLYVRVNRSNLSWRQMISNTIVAIPDWHLAYDHYKAAQQFLSQESFYMDYYGEPQNILERISYIDHVDTIKDSIDKYGTIGLKDISISFYRSLPRVIARDKPLGYSHGDWLFCETNLHCLKGTYATVPLIASGYAALGWIGAAFYPLFFGSVILLIVKFMAGFDLNRNIWGIYLLIRVHNGFVEGDSATYIQIIFRDLPQDFLVLLIIISLSKISLISAHRHTMSTK